jgi:hypothetical protein
MFTSTTGRAPRLSVGAWLRRITAILAAVTGCALAWAAVVPAASAATLVIPNPGGAGSPVPAVTPAPVRVITAGMPGWQITLIAVAAALAAAAAAVFLDRARASRRTASITG